MLAAQKNTNTTVIKKQQVKEFEIFAIYVTIIIIIITIVCKL